MLYTIVYLICVSIPVGCLPICVTLLDILIKYPGSFTSKLCGYTGKPCPGTINLRVFLLTYITYKIDISHPSQHVNSGEECQAHNLEVAG